MSKSLVRRLLADKGYLGTRVLPVRLLPGAVGLGGHPPDGIPLPVPVTDPIVVSVIWGSGPGAHHEHVRVIPGEELLVSAEASKVELRTLAGGGVVLRRAGIGRILVNGIDQGAGFAIADYAILTAAHVLGDRALHSAPPSDPAGPFASETPASEAPSGPDSQEDSRGSGPALDVTYVPEGSDPLNARVVASDTELDVVLLEPDRPAPAILPVGQIQPGQKWRLQVLPGRDQADTDQSVRVPTASSRGVTNSGYPRPEFALTDSSASLRGQSGAAITLENPWGAVIGLLLAETPQLQPMQIAEQLQAEEGATPIGPRALLRVAPIDAIVASFNLARQITPATVALVDGRWPERQPLEDLGERETVPEIESQDVGNALGIDIAFFAGEFNWAATTGLSFGICRASQGLGGPGINSPDPLLAWNWPRIKAKGLARGAYHFLDPRLSGAAQASYFVQTVSKVGLETTDMLWLDHETAGSSPAAVAACARDFMARLTSLRPHNPCGVYSFYNFTIAGNCAGLGSYPLWLAVFQSTPPTAPAPWEQWKFWQSGAASNFDNNVFNGTPAELTAWIKSFQPNTEVEAHPARPPGRDHRPPHG